MLGALLGFFLAFEPRQRGFLVLALCLELGLAFGGGLGGSGFFLGPFGFFCGPLFLFQTSSFCSTFFFLSSTCGLCLPGLFPLLQNPFSPLSLGLVDLLLRLGLLLLQIDLALAGNLAPECIVIIHHA